MNSRFFIEVVEGLGRLLNSWDMDVSEKHITARVLCLTPIIVAVSG